MKIAFLLDTYPSLTETFLARDIAALRQHGLDIHVFALQAGEGARPIVAPTLLNALWWRGAREKVGGGERTGYFKGLGARWWRGLGQEAPSFNWIHAGWASHPALLAWGAAEASRLPWSFSGHARDIFVEGGDLAGKLAAARFAAVCTRVGAEHLKTVNAAEADKIIYAPHGVDANNITFRKWSPPELPLFLAVGRLVEKKGFGVLLDALAILRAQKFTFEACILGDGPLREALAARRDHLGMRDCVRLPGARPQPEVMEAMLTAGCLVVPSVVAHDRDRDGLPNVVLEAAACGLPIVATRTGGIEEFVDEQTGWLCRSGSAEALADAIRATFDNAEMTASRCVAARSRVETGFNSMRNAAVLADAFR